MQSSASVFSEKELRQSLAHAREALRVARERLFQTCLAVQGGSVSADDLTAAVFHFKAAEAEVHSFQQVLDSLYSEQCTHELRPLRDIRVR
jgi:hypothetical protein